MSASDQQLLEHRQRDLPGECPLLAVHLTLIIDGALDAFLAVGADGSTSIEAYCAALHHFNQLVQVFFFTTNVLSARARRLFEVSWHQCTWVLKIPAAMRRLRDGPLEDTQFGPGQLALLNQLAALDPAWLFQGRMAPRVLTRERRDGFSFVMNKLMNLLVEHYDVPGNLLVVVSVSQRWVKRMKATHHRDIRCLTLKQAKQRPYATMCGFVLYDIDLQHAEPGSLPDPARLHSAFIIMYKIR